MSGQISVTSSGITVPQASEIKEAFQGVFTDALGSDLSLDDSTPQGALIDGLTEQKQLDNAQLLYFFNQLNPDTNDGIFQDSIASIFGLQRKQATHSVVNCVCTGLEGTVLNGKDSNDPAKAQSINGDVFICTVGGTIPSSGTITLQFEAEDSGEIPVGANTVNKIYSVVGGWDTVNNTSDGSLGEPEESRQDFEARRKKSLALNATGSLSSVYSHVGSVSGVTDVFVYENPTGSSVTYRGITLSPHSVFICQNGASSQSELAEAIYNSLSAGCDTNGSNTCTYHEPVTGIDYTFNYYNSTNTPIYIQVNITEGISDEVKTQIKEAFLKEFTGESLANNEKITIGTTIYASRFYNVINALGNKDVILKSVKISSNGSTWVDLLSFNMNVLPILNITSTSPNYIVFNVG